MQMYGNVLSYVDVKAVVGASVQLTFYNDNDDKVNFVAGLARFAFIHLFGINN